MNYSVFNFFLVPHFQSFKIGQSGIVLNLRILFDACYFQLSQVVSTPGGLPDSAPK